MKHNIVEVIAYLLEITSVGGIGENNLADHVIIQQRLEEAGFARDDVAKAFDWLQELSAQQNWYESAQDNQDGGGNKTIRVFSPEESSKISLGARSFILSLEYANVLDTKMREIVISQLMQLNNRSVELIDVKWVVLLVLMSKVNKNTQELRRFLLAAMSKEG